MKRITVFASFSLISFFLVLLASACGGEENPFAVKSELVTAADRSAAMAFAPDGRLFYGEQFTGKVRVITAEGELLAQPFAQVGVAVFLDWGLTGLAVDPDFETNHYVYVFFTQPVESDPPIGRPIVVRFTDENGQGVDRKLIVGDLPVTHPGHPGVIANGRIHFGPDGFLYITVGDYDVGVDPEVRESNAQNLSAPLGKILRVSKEDGSAPPDNPFVDRPDADPRIFAYGFRQNFPFVFHPETGQLYGSDHTTAATCEELNLISKGANYGWPEVGEFPFADCLFGEHTKAVHFFAKEEMQPGDFASSVSVSALAFASQKTYPLLGDSLLVCESETQLMRRLVLGGANLDQVLSDDVVDDVVVEDCERDIAVSPDGILYYSNAEEIRRLVPQAPEE